MSNNIERIKELAHKMRSAIEAVPRQERPIGLSDFPSGACGDSALLLGAYLNDCGVEGFVYVHGERWSDERNVSWSGLGIDPLHHLYALLQKGLV